jgi:serine/threonine protein phosphatase PrpC
MKFSVFQTSQIGGRKRNEDRMGYTYSKSSAIFLVADGLGGHPDGDVASQLGLQVVMSKFRTHASPRIDQVSHFLNEAMTDVHESLIAYAVSHAMLDTPSTTMVVLIIQDGLAYLAHCGDSRGYLIRRTQVLTRTQDHSLLVRDGDFSANRDQDLPSRHTLYSCLGASSVPFIEVGEPVRLQFGDRMLLCSDGLWGSVLESDIVQAMQDPKVSEATTALVNLALHNGGPRGDNVTALTVRWEEADNPAR